MRVLAIVALSLAMAGCGGPGYIRAEAIDGTMRRVIVRHRAYTHADRTLTDLQRRVNLRDGELVLKVLDEAQDPTED